MLAFLKYGVTSRKNFTVESKEKHKMFVSVVFKYNRW